MLKVYRLAVVVVSVAFFGSLSAIVVAKTCYNCPPSSACASTGGACGGVAPCPPGNAVVAKSGVTAYECSAPPPGTCAVCFACGSGAPGGGPGPVVSNKCMAPDGSLHDGHTFTCADTYACVPTPSGACGLSTTVTGTVNDDNIVCY